MHDLVGFDERVRGRSISNSKSAAILTSSKRRFGCPPCTTLSTRGFQTMTRGELGKCVCEREREIAREMLIT